MKIIITKKGEQYRIWLQNNLRQRLLLDDKAHMNLRLRSEVVARIDVVRVAFALPRKSVVWECDEVPALA
ncbi:MAG: hypothetical protein JWN23_1575 [Rhodocyclales bacterium]|nr:hypothetical protein [Rhodocyclales bacterium]